MQKNINEILQGDPLVQIIQKDNFVGWVYSIDYDNALVMTNDLWKEKAQGIPHNSFLVAASFNPEEFSQASQAEKEIILLRVIGTSKLPQEDHIIRTKIDKFQEQDNADDNILNDYDEITQNLLQFGGLECSILGTFFKRDNKLWLGSDLESFATSAHLNVYRPRGNALETIVNFIDPIKKQKAIEDAKNLGLKGLIPPFQLGTVRYTSTDRLHRYNDNNNVPFKVQPSDFLARRTAVLGMTRTGKSNTIKHTVSVVKKVAEKGGLNIGQIIYDINGEYANPNVQDKGSLSNVYSDTISYRLFNSPNDDFRGLLNNFYTHLNEGHSIIRNTINENYSGTQPDIQNFLETTFDEPPRQEYSAHNRWKVRVAAYKTLLFKAGFKPGKHKTISFPVNDNIHKRVIERAATDNEIVKNPREKISYDEIYKWFKYARDIEDDKKANNLVSSSGKRWFDEDTLSMVRMLVRENSRGSFITGYQLLIPANKYHSPNRTKEIGDEIYNLLEKGTIVILDLSVGEPDLLENMSKKIAKDIFDKSMKKFISNETPPNIVFYIEEAHNLIGKNDPLTETWPRIAKEGAKYNISLVYATQEVSSIHPNILSNTENWFVSHLNNKRELKELIKFYDFEDFSRSLLRADDVGFARVKTLSSPFVVPVQIDLFDPEKL